jgi:hypothetical protein
MKGFLFTFSITLRNHHQHQPPTWRTRVSLFIWLLPFNLSAVGGPTSSYATAGIGVRVSGALQPHHHNNVRITSVGLRKYTYSFRPLKG